MFKSKICSNTLLRLLWAITIYAVDARGEKRKAISVKS